MVPPAALPPEASISSGKHQSLQLLLSATAPTGKSQVGRAGPMWAHTHPPPTLPLSPSQPGQHHREGTNRTAPGMATPQHC